MQRGILVILAVLLSISVFIKGRRSEHHAAPAAFSVHSSAAGLVVKVSGAVRYPGIYYLSANKMTIDAIKMAEPWQPVSAFSPGDILASPVKNATELHLSISDDQRGRIAISPIPTAERLVLSVPLDMASMNVADFVRLPGVGPALAERIVAYRQKNGGIMQPEELRDIEGIGDKNYSALIGYFKKADIVDKTVRVSR